MSKWHCTAMQTHCPVCSPRHKCPFYQKPQTDAACYPLQSHYGWAGLGFPLCCYHHSHSTILTPWETSAFQFITFPSWRQWDSTKASKDSSDCQPFNSFHSVFTQSKHPGSLVSHSSFFPNINNALLTKDTMASLEESCSTVTAAHHVWGQKQADWPVWVLTVNIITARQIWSGVTGRQQQQISLMQFFWRARLWSSTAVNKNQHAVSGSSGLPEACAIRTGSGCQNYTLGLSWPIFCVTLLS